MALQQLRDLELSFLLIIKIKHTFYVQYFFFKKIVPFVRYVEKYCRAGQVTGDKMALVHCMLDT
jgi:hypothetical protein